MRMLRRALPVAMLVVLLAGAGGGVRLALSLGQPFPGFAMMWRKELKLYTVSYYTPPHWPGLVAGMEINDRILCIDGYHPNPDAVVYGLDPRYADVECPNGGKKYAELFRERFNDTNPTVEFLADRSGEIIPIPGVPLLRFTPGMLVETFLPSFLLGLGLLAVGFTVYHADPVAEINLIFASFTTIIAGLMMDQGYAVIFSDRLQDTWIVALILTVPWMPLLGAVCFHLVSLFVDCGPLPRLVRWIRQPYYILSLLFSCLGIFVYVTRGKPISIRFDWLFGGFITASCVLAVLCGLVSLGWTWLKTSSRRVRHQAGLILLGLAITTVSMIPYLTFFFTNAPGFRHIQSVPYLGLGFVALVAYAILRYQLFASKSTILTLLVTVVFCISTANLVYLVAGQNAAFLPILAVAMVTSLGLEARRGPTVFFNRLLRRESLDYQTVVRFSQRVGGLQRIESLLLAAQDSLRKDLDVEYVDVWLFDLEHQVMERFYGGKPAGSTPLPQGFAERLIAHPSSVRDTSPPPAGYRALLTDEPDRVALWAPLADRDQAVGLLGLGPRWTGEVYDEQDLQLVGILARQMALLILNTRQLERLRATSRLIAQAEENERRKIARELHDTVLQFLLVLTYGMDDLKERQPETATEIERWQDRISAEASQLRDVLSYLRAPEMLVQQGLIASLQAWIEWVRQDTAISIQTDLSVEAEQALPVKAQVAIYRVFREAIRNAVKHSSGSCVQAQLQLDGDSVYFSIQDDGRGFDVEQALQAGGKGYSSLQDMRIYVENVGGRLDIHSVMGEGTVVEGEVSVKIRQTVGA